MVSMDDAVLARMEKGGKRDEVLVDPTLVDDFKENPDSINIDDFFVMDEVFHDAKGGENDFTEREILYKVLFDMKKDIGELKKLTKKLMKGEVNFDNEMNHLDRKVFNNYEDQDNDQPILLQKPGEHFTETKAPRTQEIIPQESLSLQDKEIEMIKNALEKHKGKRKGAASELGISERTLYRKIKQFEL